MTFAQLETTLSQPALQGLRLLPPGGRRLALGGLLQKAKLPAVFQALAQQPGSTSALESIILELAAGGGDPAELEACASRLPPWLKGRVEALAQLTRAYVRHLAERKLADPAFALAGACRALEEGAPLPRALQGFEAIELRHLVDWPPSRVRLVRALTHAARAAGTHVVVVMPEIQGDQPEAADALDPAFRALEAGGDLELGRSPLAQIPRERVHAFTAADDTGEAREIAARVASLIREGSPLGDIAIAANDARDVSPRLQEALADLGIPTRSRQGTSLAHATLARLAADLAGWEAPEEATRERVCALLSCTAVNLSLVAGEPVDALQIVRDIRAAAIRSRTPDRAGTDGFATRLERLARSFDRGGKPEAADRARRSAAVIARFFRRLDARPPQATLVRHAHELLALLEDVGAVAWLTEMAAPDALDARQGHALALEQAAWRRLVCATQELEDASALLDLRERVLSRATFADWLSGMFAAASLRPGTTRGAAVEILELGDLAGRRFRHVFLASAAEGRLPGRAATDAFFTDEERWLVNGAMGRPILRVAPSTTAASPFPSAALLDAASVALAAEAATESLTVSRPRSDDRGRPYADSPLVSLIASNLEFEAVPFRPLDPVLARNSSSSIEARRQIALSRAAFFRGESDLDPYGGDVSAIAARLQPFAPGTRTFPWSASKLETLATCGFRYLAEWAWRAKEEDEPDDQAGPMEIGRLAHLAAETAVQAMVDAGVWSPKDATAAVELGLEAATRIVGEHERATVLGHPELWELTRGKMLGRLRHLLRLEVERTATDGVAPFGMELSFGLPDATLPALEIGGVLVGGQIDRVDVGPDSVMVLDYKSGGTPYNTTRFDEDDLFLVQLQLPIYVAAMDALLPEARGKQIDAAYVSLRDVERTRTLRETMRGATTEEIRERIEAGIVKAVSRVRDGRFAVEPRSCQGCHLQPVCRIPRLEKS